jgi:hypothetical protein
VKDGAAPEFEHRWVLYRPRGGLNDMLCHVEKCWAYAEKFSRRLVVDVNSRTTFSALFTLLEPKEATIVTKFQLDSRLLGL